MKGFFSWFKSENKIKRWIFLILLSIVAICYAISNVLVTNTLDIKSIIKIIMLFVFGFVGTIFGIISIQKRTLELLVKQTDKRDNVKSLIYNKKVYSQGPKIVVIGGGNGLNSVLRGLKTYTDNITAIVTVSDYENKKSNSRMLLDSLPVDDIKKSIIALSKNEETMEDLMNYRFSYGNLNSLSFGDVYLSAMQNIYSDFSKSVEKTKDILNITGRVLPVTQDKIEICAELKDGTVVRGREEIPNTINEKVTNINRVYITPSNSKPAPGVLEAIKDADAIVIGPGSLYTNVIPNLLVNGVAKAIKESTGLKVYISNIMTEPGQTDNYSVSDHLNAIIDHCGKGIIDYCIYDTGEIIPEFIKKYNFEGQDLVEQDIEKVKGIKFLQRNLSMISDEHIRHDPNLVASSIIELICDDLKYQDKQNDPQYLMLNNKLREDKRINKIKKQMAKDAKKGIEPKEKNSSKKGKSKFSNKYSDRIASIREADEKARKKNEKEFAKKEKKGNKRTKKVGEKDIQKNKKRTSQELREEMLKKLENSKLK